MTVREFLRTVWDGKWYVLAAVVIVIVAAMLYLRGQTTVYRAEAQVQLSSVQAGEQTTAVTASSDPSIVVSDPVAAAVAQEIGGGASPVTLAHQVQSTFDPETLVMTISARDAGPVRSATLANDFAAAYVDYLPTVVTQQQKKLDRQIDAINDQITTARSTLKSHPRDPKATALESSGTSTLNTLTSQVTALTSLDPPAQVVTRASAGVPLGLGRDSVLALSLLAGLAAGVGLAFARRGVDFHVRSVAQAAEVANVPVLAELDGVRRALKDAAHHHNIPVASRVATPYTESIRELRTAVQVSVRLRDHAVIVVTAADPSAPRSFITANLAASLALSGRRTIVFSGDMRRPELDDLLPAPEEWSGSASDLRPTRVANLSLYPVPEQPLDPADYLATPAARRLVESMRERADIVVIDAPPVLAAADATILGSYSDGVVLLATVGKTDEAVLRAAVERLRVNDVPVSGLAVEGITGSRRMAYAATYGDAAAAASHAEAVAPAPAPEPAAVPSPAGRPVDSAAGGDDRPAHSARGDRSAAAGVAHAATDEGGTRSSAAAEASVDTPAASPLASRRDEARASVGAGSAAGRPVSSPSPTPRTPVASTPAVRPGAVPPSIRPAPAAGGASNGRRRIQPAWSPVQARPQTGTTPTVGTTPPSGAAEPTRRPHE